MMDDEQPAAILGCTRTVRTTVDGSMLISIEIEPRHAQAAFALFGAPGTPVAMARIVSEVAQRQAQRETAEADKPRGGALCKLAGMLCNNPQFLEFLRLKYAPLPRTPEDAAEIIRRSCHIFSRSELDHNEPAAATFHDEFRIPFTNWQFGRGA